jgi:hypothetical protein
LISTQLTLPGPRDIFLFMKNKLFPFLISILFLPLFSPAAGSGAADTQGSILQRWTFSAEALGFGRVGTAKYTLVERVPGAVLFRMIPLTPGTPALNSTDLKQDFSPGFGLGAIYHVDSNREVSLSFFRIADWDSIRSIGPDNPLDWLVMRAPGGFFQTQDFTYQSMTWDYSADLYSAEISVRNKISNRITLLAGFRWLRLHENLQGTIPPADLIQPLWKNNPLADLAYVAWYERQPGGIQASEYPPFWVTRTVNNLYGFQIGADAGIFQRGRFSLNGLIKLGGYWNHASESSGVSIAKVVYQSGDSIDRAAFVCEAGLQCKYQVAGSIKLKLGYQGLWLYGVALAPGQIEETYSAFGPTRVHARGVKSDSNVFFHGVGAALEYSF